MLRTFLLVIAGLAATAGAVAVAWAALAVVGSRGWRSSADLFVPSVGIGGVALLIAALVCVRYSGRTGRKGDPAHAVDVAAKKPE